MDTDRKIVDDFLMDYNASEVFRDLVVTGAVKLYCAKTTEECSAFGPPNKVFDDPKTNNDFGVGRSLNSSTNLQSSSMESSPMIPGSTEGSPPPPPMMVLDLARLVLGQSFRCHPADDGPGTRTAGCRPPTTGGRKSSTTTTPDRGSTGSSSLPAAGKTLGLRTAGKRNGKRRKRKRSKRTKKTSTTLQSSTLFQSSSPGSAGSRLLPISFSLGFNSEDGTLTAHPLCPGSPQRGAESTGGPSLGSGGPTPKSSTPFGGGIGVIKLRPVSRSFAKALFHSWTVLYYPASLLLSTDAGGGGSIDDLDGPTNPYYLRWLESYRFLVDQLDGNDPRG